MGPLEVSDGYELLSLGGTKQRATLAYLLLHANRVVPTSQLLTALWSVDGAPTSARKILQNAVWGLRRVLSPANQREQGARLLTQAPGYQLALDPTTVDLHRFQQQVEVGRQRLDAGDAEAASRLLREATGLWRGRVLADLAEAGVTWPEMGAVQNTLWDAMEDYFEAELRCGRHLAIVGELEVMIESAAVRERSFGQLMLALYRAGRQVDALGVYSRARAKMIEELGLEPGRELQKLQQAILAHDPALYQVPSTGARPRVVVEVPAAEVAPVSEVVPEVAAAPEPPLVPRPREAKPERGVVSVVLVRAQAGPLPSRDPHAVDQLLEDVSQHVRDTVEHFGGTLSAIVGSVSVALFHDCGAVDDDAERAVLAALAIRDDLEACAADDPSCGLVVSAAVVTGEALLRSRDGARAGSAIRGALLDRGHALLSLAEPGEIRVCEDTRAAAGATIGYERTADRAYWAVQGIRLDAIGQNHVPTVEREFDLEVLRSLLDRAGHWSTAHLVTVLGEAGTGKTRLLAEFGRLHGDRAHLVHLCLGRIAASGKDATQVVQDELARAIRAAEGAAPSVPDGRINVVGGDGTSVSWHRVLAHAALDQPVVLVIDDLHRADDALLDFVDGLADHADTPLLVVGSARPDLLRRRPGWGLGKRHNSTLTLEPLTDAGVDRLIDGLVAGENVIRWIRWHRAGTNSWNTVQSWGPLLDVLSTRRQQGGRVADAVGR
ncbi:BTAD domain-containing putative transcriptional regulator [Saccharothrix deserti]|uniref:BTAD domain-containing putative transcriptional regulator n=1 Tax=Saccharothrix deserti TaxID=2593674 RepID=UPI00131AB10A|nr:BTAD domain-containing putative transcriptional regulator [Saccharothrix deserti]